MGFQELGLNEHLVLALTEAGYEAPTSVQEKSIPVAIAGRDLIVSSQTGSGKTAAFMLPALHRMNEEANAQDPLQRLQFTGPRLLVLTPTRELAMQVTEACRKYGRHVRYARAVSVVGGMPYPVQNRQLSQKFDVLVATPGRLMDHMARGRIDFSSLQMLVLDEADRMLDMGFIDDIEHILKALPAERQTLLFSATVDSRIEGITRRLMRDPERIEITSDVKGHANIEQRMMYADDLKHKTRLLDALLRDTTLDQAIVFTATKRDAESLAIELDAAGFAAAALHGDMTQGQRNRTLTGLRRGALRVLVATDVAARGIDVQTISHVINFDLPRSPEDYVHRIGRTGRAGRSGVAISLAGGRERGVVKAIERYTRNTIAVHTIAGMEPRARVEEKKTFGQGRPEGRREGFGARREEPSRFNRDGQGAQRDAQTHSRPQRDGNRYPDRAAPFAQRDGNRDATSRNRGFGADTAPRTGRDFNRDGQRPDTRPARDFKTEGPRGNVTPAPFGQRDTSRDAVRTDAPKPERRSFGQDDRAPATTRVRRKFAG